MDERETAATLRRSPIAQGLPEIQDLLSSTSKGSNFAVLSDESGLLLWAHGDSSAWEGARAAGFLPGHLCSEEAVGTNGVGTSLRLKRTVQIFAAEHYSRRLHSLVCAASPIYESGTDQLLGVLNISADFRRGHPQTLALVGALARVIEQRLELRSQDEENQLRDSYFEWAAASDASHSALVTSSGRVLAAQPRGWLGSRLRSRRPGTLVIPKGVRVDPFRVDSGATMILRGGAGGTLRRAEDRAMIVSMRGSRILVVAEDMQTVLGRRHGQILLGLVQNPAGLSTEELGLLVYGKGWKPKTLRAEVSRLRAIIGPFISAEPYRLTCRVDTDLPAR